MLTGVGNELKEVRGVSELGKLHGRIYTKEGANITSLILYMEKVNAHPIIYDSYCLYFYLLYATNNARVTVSLTLAISTAPHTIAHQN